jgi:hypothetical protein
VDVLVGLAELELAVVQLALDAAKATLDQREARPGQKARREKPARMRNAAGDIERVQLEVRLQRRRESLELRMERLAEAASPELGYGVSLFTSPNSFPRSRLCSWPWTFADVRTPMPHSLMKPAAADWSNSSPFP